MRKDLVSEFVHMKEQYQLLELLNKNIHLIKRNITNRLRWTGHTAEAVFPATQLIVSSIYVFENSGYFLRGN